MLSPDDFGAFFSEVHGHEPFPWQLRLLRQVAERGMWPTVLDLPTGSGKTAALDVATFHLALEADCGARRNAPVRIAFVVDRRLVVDDAFAHAQRLERVLSAPLGPITSRVAERLAKLSTDGPPLVARRLRGGVPREDDWARTPAQPTILCSTVDQVGSRILFRGYGVSDSMKPVHAGLIGSDCLILLDEAHLAEPFRQTLHWIGHYRSPAWRERDSAAPWGVALLTATPGERTADTFSIERADRRHPVLSRRLNASKPARLVAPTKSTAEADESPGAGVELDERVGRLVLEVQGAIEHFEKSKHGAPCPAIGIVVNRVVRARAVFEQLRRTLPAGFDTLLLIGPARAVDRDALAAHLAVIRTAAPRDLARPLVIVATQCIEAGVDIDLDALVTEAAPLDALRQRFGRLNRAGRPIKPYAAIVAAGSDIAGRVADPVYGTSIAATWHALSECARVSGSQSVEFGSNGFTMSMGAEVLSPRVDAPVLLPAHLDLLSQTSPIPAADPDISLYLHGADREPDAINVVWRSDISPREQRGEQVRKLLMLVPPRSAESIQLPLWAVRRWMMGQPQSDELADIASAARAPTTARAPQQASRHCFRWVGDDERSRWIAPDDLRAGDTVIVPSTYGRVDEFGWNPDCSQTARDVVREAAVSFAGRRFTVRVAPGLLPGASDDSLADALTQAVTRGWRDLRNAVLTLDLPALLREDLHALDRARSRRVVAYTDVYGDADGRPRGVVFVAPFGIKDAAEYEDGPLSTTEDDLNGSLPGYRLTLTEHSADVEHRAEQFARACLGDERRARDVKLAGFLHDAGKADPRFQAWLHYGDPLSPDPEDAGEVLAKSARALPAAARTASTLPADWRHEALSVRLALQASSLKDADDPELVVWLIGSHHGFGRPFFPHHDPQDAQPRTLPSVLGLPSELDAAPGPQSLAFEWHGLDWCALFEKLKARYGVWELARMEAIVRLADHRASEDAARRSMGTD
jgi:CRISPR-associated endonuclease/helicase Cas3